METVAENTKEKSPTPGKADRQKFKRERPVPYSKGNNQRRAAGGPPFNRVLVTNIPYEEKWQALKDLFRQKIGEVTYVELFTDENGRSRGYGVVEFRSKELCEKAVKDMSKHEILGRKIIVKEDYNGELISRVLRRDNVMTMSNNNNNRGSVGPQMPPMPPPMRRQDIPPVGLGGVGIGVGMGLPRLGAGDALELQKVLQRNGAGVGGSGPVGKTVFVANLDYKVTYAKLKEVFSLAGRIFKVDMLLNKDNKSRGMATITFEDPMGAAEAISMLNGQSLYERPMVVKMDKDSGGRDGFKLPAGLSGLGPTLSARHRNVRDFAPGGVGDLSPNPAVGILGGGALAGLSALSQQASHLNDTLQSNPLVESRNPLGGLASLAGLSDLSRLASISSASREPTIDQRFLEERARLLAAAQGISAGPTDRERIDMDIARVDSRIRDLNRTIVDHGRRTVDLPPMPPPMNMSRSNGNNGGMMNNSQRTRGCTVFVRNLAYTITWQQLRERFNRCGTVMFADIKNDNQGKSRGFGYVRFEEPDQAKAAARLFDQMEWEGRKLAVELKPENRD